MTGSAIAVIGASGHAPPQPHFGMSVLVIPPAD
jgi:hypothetical protein